MTPVTARVPPCLVPSWNREDASGRPMPSRWLHRTRSFQEVVNQRCSVLRLPPPSRYTIGSAAENSHEEISARGGRRLTVESGDAGLASMISALEVHTPPARLSLWTTDTCCSRLRRRLTQYRFGSLGSKGSSMTSPARPPPSTTPAHSSATPQTPSPHLTPAPLQPPAPTPPAPSPQHPQPHTPSRLARPAPHPQPHAPSPPHPQPHTPESPHTPAHTPLPPPLHPHPHTSGIGGVLSPDGVPRRG